MLVFSLPRALVEPRLAALAEHLPRALRGNAKAVHQARVASRRLREVLPVVGRAAGARRLRRARRRVREVTRALGPVRELDVALGVLDDLVASDPSLAFPIGLVRRLVASEREERRSAMLVAFAPTTVDRTRTAVESVLRRLAAAPDEGTWRAPLARRALSRARTLTDAMQEVGLIYDPARLHLVRIAAKRLRYTLEVAGEARLAPTGRLVATLRETQEQLGRLHDLAVVLFFVRQADTEPSPRRRQALAALRERLERECHRHHARYLRRRARVLASGEAVVELLGHVAEAPGLEVRPGGLRAGGRSGDRSQKRR